MREEKEDKVLVISIKPEYSNMIFSGYKSMELRKSKPNVNNNSVMLVYNTKPEMAIVGVCLISDIIDSTPSQIWKEHSNLVGIRKSVFKQYYLDEERAIGIILSKFEKFENPIKLEKVKNHLPLFNPPQTYRYLSISELTFLSKREIKLIRKLV